MKIFRFIYFTQIFIISLLIVNYSQAQCDEAEFRDFINDGDRFLNKKPPNYHKAVYAYTAAMITCTDSVHVAEAQNKLINLFDIINDLKIQADSAKIVAQTERNHANFSLSQAESAMLKAAIEKQNAIREQKRADSALGVAKKIIDQLYFYNGKFALALKKDSTHNNKNIYGFIDKCGNTVIPFKYDEAYPFDENTGMAKVKKSWRYYLIDTLGKSYYLCEDVNRLDKNTEALDLQFKGLKDIPNKVFQNKQLKILLLSYNLINEIPKDISKLSSNLFYMDLSKNKLKELPPVLGNLKDLKILDLSYNNLDSIPAEIGNLKNLQSLYLDRNRLFLLPFDIKNLSKLEKFTVSNNQLFKIQDEICLLTNLKELHLEFNQIEKVPVEIENLINLSILTLNDNKLQTLPEEISKLSNLQILSLQNNQLPEEEKQRITRMLPNCKIYF